MEMRIGTSIVIDCGLRWLSLQVVTMPHRILLSNMAEGNFMGFRAVVDVFKKYGERDNSRQCGFRKWSWGEW